MEEKGVIGELKPDDRFDSLYDGHRVALVAYCRRRVTRDVVDDVMAEVFLSAWRRIDQIPEGAELPWLYSVARNVVANHRRGDTRRSRLGLRVVGERPESSAEDAADGAMGEATLVLSALAGLSEADQELLRLRAWEDLSSAEIAIALGINAPAVDMRLSRARRRLEDSLKKLATSNEHASTRVNWEGIS